MKVKSGMDDRVISIVLVNYNALDFTEQCIRSIIADDPAVACEIVVVDNRSGNQDEVRTRLGGNPRVRLVLSDKNLGFTGGNNVGVRAASGEFVCILNNDTEVYLGTLGRLAVILESACRQDVVTGYIDGPDRQPQQVCGREPTLLSEFIRFAVFMIKYVPLPYFRDFNIKTWENDRVQEADWATGAFFAMKREFYLSLGGFDENIFMYMEDVELHTRVRNAGGRILYYPDLRILHYGAQSSRKLKGGAVQHQYRSTVYFFSKHKGAAAGALFRWGTKAVFAAWLCVFALLYGITAGRNERFGTKMKLFVYLLRA